jgi:glycosyltransferase involved in cell wall biosynthesis
MRAFHPIYNPEMAIKVVARLRGRGIPATLVMGGSDRGSLASAKSLATELNVVEAVRFTGFLGPLAKMHEGNAADIFLNTNRIDNTPVAVIEACAMGLPVVATNVGGISDLLRHDESGLLVPDENDDAMGDSLARLLSNPELVRKLSRNGRQLACQSSWPAIKPQWEALFRELGLAFQ